MATRSFLDQLLHWCARRAVWAGQFEGEITAFHVKRLSTRALNPTDYHGFRGQPGKPQDGDGVGARPWLFLSLGSYWVRITAHLG